MAVLLDKFIQQLEDSGIIAVDTLRDYIPPKGSPKDAEDLARELIRHKKLTKFQAEEVSKGKGKSLTLGNYLLMEQIGIGGMGQVFKAHHRRMDRFVAIKLLPTALTQDTDAIARFEREVKAAAKLSHPNIVTAFDADQAQGIHFLVMELVEGSDLAALVKRNGPLSVGQSINYILQAARGLDAAHKKGIVHRDIKPANLLLDFEGTVKILDMGLARLSGDLEEALPAALTSSNVVMGTVDYMAPEQAVNTKTADARADIYALGCALFYLLAGRPVYGGSTLMAKLLAHRDQPIPALREVREDVSKSLDAVFHRMLEKKMEDRYQTMAEVIVDLEKCNGIYAPHSLLANRPPSGKPSDQRIEADQGLTGYCRRNAWQICSSVLAFVVVLASCWALLDTGRCLLVVTVDQPDATVQVLDIHGEVEVSQVSEQEAMTIDVLAGNHRLKISKHGFRDFTDNFEIKAGDNVPIVAKLEPLSATPSKDDATKPAAEEVVRPRAMAAVPMPLAYQDPNFDRKMQEVAALPPEKQVLVVSQMLMELNPGFDGELEGYNPGEMPRIDSGVVESIGLTSDHVRDISPLRAMAGLKSLRCSGSKPGQGLFSDLSPLTNMSLTKIDVSHNPVSNLSFLSQLRLKMLTIHHTDVSDLSPLKGLLLEVLNCRATPVEDLTPLVGMPLIGLDISETRTIDIASLQDLPLKKIAISFQADWHTAVLRSIPTLENINGVSAPEFWANVAGPQ